MNKILLYTFGFIFIMQANSHCQDDQTDHTMVMSWVCRSKPLYVLGVDTLEVFRLPEPPFDITDIFQNAKKNANDYLVHEAYLYLIKFARLYVQEYGIDYILDDPNYKTNSIIEYARFLIDLEIGDYDYLAPYTSSQLASELLSDYTSRISSELRINKRQWLCKVCEDYLK